MAQAGATLNRRGPNPANKPRIPFVAYIVARRLLNLAVGNCFAGFSKKRKKKIRNLSVLWNYSKVMDINTINHSL